MFSSHRSHCLLYITADWQHFWSNTDTLRVRSVFLTIAWNRHIPILISQNLLFHYHHHHINLNFRKCPKLSSRTYFYCWRSIDCSAGFMETVCRVPILPTSLTEWCSYVHITFPFCEKWMEKHFFTVWFKDSRSSVKTVQLPLNKSFDSANPHCRSLSWEEDLFTHKHI